MLEAIYISRIVCCELCFYIKRVENSFTVQRIRRKQRRKPSFSFIKLKFWIKTEWKLSLFCSQNFWLGEDLFRLNNCLKFQTDITFLEFVRFQKKISVLIRKIIFSLIYHDSCLLFRKFRSFIDLNACEKLYQVYLNNILWFGFGPGLNFWDHFHK